MNPAAIYGWLAHAIVFGALVSLLPLGAKRRHVGLAAVPLALLAGIATLLHGFAGPPSATLLALAAWQLAGRGPSPLGQRPAWLVIGFAVLFYPLALGLGPFDPYAIGYQPWPLLLACGALAAGLWKWRRNDWLLILALALAAYAGGLFANLWDALVDPLLVLTALAVAVRQLARRASAGGKTAG
ncbi:MAG: hypothetical protein KA535_00015 [Azonexus sp.]|nr:hypothetical protein [Azonexus sp.]